MSAIPNELRDDSVIAYMKSFDQVTPATQRKWLRQLGYAALERYDIKNAKLRFISKSSSAVFCVETVNQRYVLRINTEPPDQWKIWTEAEILWLLALKRDTELSVPEPIAAPDGTFVHNVSTDKIPEGRLATLLRWIPGQKIGKHPASHIVKQMGACMAQLHNHTEQFSLPNDINRPYTSWDKLNYWQDRQNDTSDTLTTEQRDLCALASERLLVEIEEMSTSEDYGLIHADLTLNNCVLHQGRIQLIDFADSRYASHYYDIAVPLTNLTEYWDIGHQEYERLQATFYEGYSSIRSLGRHYKYAVETFIVARAFDVIEWIHLDWPSPTHFSSGPKLLSSALHQIRNYIKH